jgi:DNA-binding GntR family transcriptional regulator
MRMVLAAARLRPLSRLRLIDDVFQSLEEAILSGRIRPGERLTEVALAEQLDVSRTTVREALLMLEREGLVVSRPRRGTFVTRLSQEDALDLGFNRALLEGFAVSAGYARIDQVVFDRMQRQLAAMAACHLPNDIPQLLRIDLEFHRPLVEVAQSSRLLELWSSLNGQVRALYITTLESRHGSIEDIVAFHQRLLDAVQSGDPHVAQRAVLEHYVRLPDGASFGSATTEAIETIAPHFQTLQTNINASKGQQP